MRDRPLRALMYRQRGRHARGEVQLKSPLLLLPLVSGAAATADAATTPRCGVRHSGPGCTRQRRPGCGGGTADPSPPRSHGGQRAERKVGKGGGRRVTPSGEKLLTPHPVHPPPPAQEPPFPSLCIILAHHCSRRRHRLCCMPAPPYRPTSREAATARHMRKEGERGAGSVCTLFFRARRFPSSPPPDPPPHPPRLPLTPPMHSPHNATESWSHDG